ncbi:Ribosomal RNA-processing protein 7 A like [Actinidia chinensis var. chinensis]|uniref:Ribosomal RNA-processing protein 7 A like n=1 Tax=Actinidia chinensis var. chinensis TaxID=1590841 RepID=A0A2R6RKK5_ACTCC|nr:Ribosomal RNA-processing protein 7 A like [Actinidia chinensis var. chinensis]
MGTEDSHKSLKTTKQKMKKNRKCHEKKKPKINETVVPEPNFYRVKEETEKNKSLGQKRKGREKGSETEAAKVDQCSSESPGEVGGQKKKVKLLRKKKINNDVINKADLSKVDELDNEVEGGLNEQNGSLTDRENKECKLRKKRQKSDNKKKSGVDKIHELCNEVEEGSKEESDVSKKARKAKKKARLSSRKDEKLLERREEPEQTEVYEMSSGDEDCSRGMKKLITEYQQSRPGLKILQQRIDDFMTDFEAQEEQARKEREALAEEGGWTVVVHHKGRKKTTDAETGVTVGSVAQADVLDNMAKKKSKDIGLDFYRFQKRESQRNEIMALQSKFERDKKRIQQLRAARKFKPY